MTGFTRAIGAWPPAPTLLLLFVVGLLGLAPGQMSLPPLDREEARTIQMTRQMIESGDYLVPRFQDHPFFAEPPAAHWLQALAAGAFGETAAPVAVYRLPSYLAAALSLPLAAWALAPLVGRGGAAVAALIMGSTALFHLEARLGQIEMPLLVTVLLAQGALARMWRRERAGPLLPSLFWSTLSFGLLIDGPLIIAPLLGAAGGALLATRQAPPRAMFGLKIGLVVLGVTVAPWLAAITWVSDGAFWTEALDGAHVGGLLDLDRLGATPPGIHAAALIATFWPMAILLALAAPGVWRRRREHAVGFLLGWIVLTWLVLETLLGQVLDASLIVFPALAGLVGLSIEGLGSRSPPRVAARSFMVTLFAIPAAALVLATMVAPLVVERAFEPLAMGLGSVALLALGAAALALWRWRLDRFIALAGVGALIGYAGLLQFAVPSLDTGLIAPRLAAAEARWRCGAIGPVALTTFREPSAVFMLGSDTILVDGVGAANALREGRAAMAFVGDAVMMEFAAAMGGGAMALERIDGINPVSGAEVHLTLYAVGREPGHPCVP